MHMRQSSCLILEPIPLMSQQNAEVATVYYGSFLHAWQPTHVRTTASRFAQVRGGDDPFDIPLYVMCRRWVRNDPYNDEAHVAEPQVGQ